MLLMKRNIVSLLTPDSSQEYDESKCVRNNSKKKIQAIFNSGSTASSMSRSITCEVCGLVYHSHIQRDKETHRRYHNNFVQGVQWPASYCTILIKKFSLHLQCQADKKVTDGKRTKTSISSEGRKDLSVVVIDKRNAKQIKRTEEVLNMVNNELNAPSACSFWKEESNDAIPGKAFVLVMEGRAIGLCTTEPIRDIERQCRWMVHRTQNLVPLQVNKHIKLGISRIWIAPWWRRNGLAKLLLNMVVTDSIYGINLDKKYIGFSQPSYHGGLLAKSFNGVMHKSGEVLIPVYLEANEASR